MAADTDVLEILQQKDYVGAEKLFPHTCALLVRATEFKNDTASLTVDNL